MGKRIILVTGSHRSGSTWVGNVIAKSRDSVYLHEPFHPRSKTEFEHYPFKHMFQYIDRYDHDDQDALTYIDEISQTVSSQTASAKTNIILKDPMAFFATEWFYDRFKCDIICCMRHPLAFVASIKNKNWTFNFRNFNKQAGLINTYLKSFQEQIIAAIQNDVDIIRQGILLWNIFAYTSYMYSLKYRNMVMVTNEELSINPFWSFKSIFNYLDLEFSDSVREYILSTTNQKVKDRISRNSAINIYNWQNILDASEIQQIKEGTRNYSELFYSELSWLKPFKIYNGKLTDVCKINEMRSHDSEIDIVFDRINSKKLKDDFESAFIKAVQEKKSDQINLKGRALNKKAKLSFSDIYLQFDTFFVKGIYGLLRTDVSKFFNSDNLLNCGFEIDIPLSIFSAYEAKEFEVYLFQNNSVNCFSRRISLES